MDAQSNFFANGSQWVRADFHLHTRRDKEFKDDGNEKDFVARYVAALKQADIRVGVITNHNKFDRDEFRTLSKAAKKEDIYLLPGIELSVKDGANGIHTLVVFNEEWIVNQEQADHINGFLNATFAGLSNYDNNNARSNDDLLSTIKSLDHFQRDYMLIFAHVEADNGLYGPGGLEGGRMQELGKNEFFRMRTAAFQKVRTRDTKRKVQEWLGDWYPAEVEGSDPKSLQDVGRGEKSFIKIGAFTFEAVQFALKPGADRVAPNEPTRQPHAWVRSIRFEGGILDGKRFDFSNEMNCLIGIRGSGKSAVLESLRYTLGLPFDETLDDAKYKQDLIRFALGSGGKVLVELQDEQGRLFEVRRILNDNADVYFEGQLRPGVRIPLKNPLFFGQKELVRKGEGFERDLVERLLGARLDNVRREIAGQRQKVQGVLANLNKFKDLDTQEQEYLAKRKDAEFRLDLFRRHGVEEQLRRQVDFNADVTHAKRAVDAADAFVRSMESFFAEQAAELSAQGNVESQANADLLKDFNAIWIRIRQLPEKGRILVAEARQDVHALRAKYTELLQRREALKEEFAAIERQLSAQLQQQGGVTVRPDDFVRLNEELRNTKLALDEITKNKARRTALRDDLTKEVKALSDLWHAEFKQIDAEIKKLNESQTALKISGSYKGDKVAFLKHLLGSFRGSRLREATLDGVTKQYSDFAAVHTALDAVCASIGDSGEVFRKYFNEAKGDLLTWQVPNLYEIEYHKKPLRDHSLGQRASALILFILSQRDNDVIVIDQPEDDLDNQTIFEDVIKLLRKLKKDIQFIFATHNANFPVLGDAEQVGACSFTGGQGDVVVGSIDNPAIQKSIVSIMEGGHEAFARRKEIYQLWKQ